MCILLPPVVKPLEVVNVIARKLNVILNKQQSIYIYTYIYIYIYTCVCVCVCVCV
jgi:hypothetical protein